jgi:hypothetical protein
MEEQQTRYFEVTYVRRNKVPVLERRSETHCGWNRNERKLVAQSTEPEDIAPALATVQPHG